MSEEISVTELPLGESIQDFLDEMLDCLDWDLEVEVHEEVSEERETVRIEFFGGDSAILIQNRAEVLDAFRFLTIRVFGRELSGRRVVVDCDGFRARKEKELIEIAMKVAARVRRTGEEERLVKMNPFERRIVHLAVAEEEGVSTESEGDGVVKQVVVFPSEP